MKAKIIETINEVKQHEQKVNAYLEKLSEEYNIDDIKIKQKVTRLEDNLYYTTFIFSN